MQVSNTSFVLQKLVESYFQGSTPRLKEKIIRECVPLVRSVIGKIRKPDGLLTQDEDLESVALMGVIEALDSYDLSKNIQFSTFAHYRIRGNIIDYLRMVDRMPRPRRQKYGQAVETIDSLTQRFGRVPEDFEVAEEMDMELKDYQLLLSDVQQRNALSLDTDLNSKGRPLYEITPDGKAKMPDSSLDHDYIVERLRRRIGQLPEREKLVLTLYYFEDLTMNEVAQLLEYTESRISQIIGELLLRFQKDLEPNPV